MSYLPTHNEIQDAREWVERHRHEMPSGVELALRGGIDRLAIEHEAATRALEKLNQPQ